MHYRHPFHPLHRFPKYWIQVLLTIWHLPKVSSLPLRLLPFLIFSWGIMFLYQSTGKVQFASKMVYSMMYCMFHLCLETFSQFLRLHSGSRKRFEFTTYLVFIRDCAIGGLTTTRIVDPSTHLYTFSHFGPPSPLSEHTSSLSREHHVVQPRYLNLCIVPEITIFPPTPHLVEVFFLQ